ncbi:MAG TPA: TauD/TfdA family dioxygenase [Acidimicrobiales bacterium]|nr:TauD/TfdA family dioxygenase [Acidimicrobiales bacterium]
MTTTAGTALQSRKLTGSIGIEFRGVNLAELDSDGFAMIKAALLDHGVVVVRGQDLTPAEHKALGERFGPLHTHPAAPGVDGYPEILLLQNYGKSRTITEVWHSDVTCEARPPSVSILHARVLPAYGGDTMWANQYLAYDRLSDGMKRMLEGTRAVHAAFNLESVHPVIRTHPETGRRALFVNAGFTRRFEDMSPEESRPLLDLLVRHATAPDLCYRHQWSAGDLVMWDNRGVMHFAVHDYDEEERVMHRVTVQGDEPR